MSDQIKEAKDVVQSCVGIATAWVGRNDEGILGDPDEDEVAQLVQTLTNEFPEELLRLGFSTACMLLGGIASMAAEFMEKEDGTKVTPSEILATISISAEGWFE